MEFSICDSLHFRRHLEPLFDLQLRKSKRLTKWFTKMSLVFGISTICRAKRWRVFLLGHKSQLMKDSQKDITFHFSQGGGGADLNR